jgi:RNA polymerase sigma-70 factor (ECF subfamily)
VLNTESSWLVQAQKGDSGAFTQLVETYQRPVFNLCYRMLSNAEDAEDAAQETFLRAYRSIKRYDNSRPFGTWLLSIAAHYCIDQIRKRRMAIVSIEDLPYLELTDDCPGPESTMSRREEQNRIQTILKGLNEVDRVAVVMYYWYDFSYDEIAEMLSLTLSAVKSRLHRARRELADQWIKNQSQPISMERKQHESPAF